MRAAADTGDGGAGGRRITIVGDGQAGLVLAIGLRRAGHAVRLVQDRPSAIIASGRLMSSHCMFATARREERKLGLDLWAADAPAIQGIRIEALLPSGSPAPVISFTGPLGAVAASVDQRLKLPPWLALFEALGGTLDIQARNIDLLERCARDSELVIVAAGQDPLSGLFPIDRQRSPFPEPMRALSMINLRGGHPPDGRPCVATTGVPGAGGLMRFPALTHGGPCEILFFEAVIGGPLDIGRPNMGADEQWSIMRAALRGVLPAEAERLEAAGPTDEGAGLIGRITPTVRYAVGRQPSGRHVLGLGDAVVVNDPLMGQGRTTRPSWRPFISRRFFAAAAEPSMRPGWNGWPLQPGRACVWRPSGPI
jgi:Styrene monooxygenase A putative substrate binding domain